MNPKLNTTAWGDVKLPPQERNLKNPFDEMEMHRRSCKQKRLKKYYKKHYQPLWFVLLTLAIGIILAVEL